MRAVRRMLVLLAPDHRRLAGAAAVAVAAELAAVALTGTAAWLIATAAGHPGIAALAPAIVAVRALATGRGVLRYVDRLTGHDAVLAALARLRTTVFRALIPLAPSGACAFRGGDLLTRLVDDVEAVADLLLRCLLPAVVCGVVGAAAVAVAGVALPAAGAALLAGLAVAAVAIPAAQYRAARRGDTTRRLRASLADAVVDLSDGAPELVAFGAAGTRVAAAAALAEQVAAVERRRAPGRSAAGAGLALVQGLTTAAVGLLAAGAAAGGRIGPVTAAVLPVLALATLEVAAPLPAAATRFADVRSSARRLVAVLEAPPPVVDPAHPGPDVRGPGRIEVRGLRARHPGSPAPALDGVDLVLEPGRRTALVGASGSGKSTLLAVLMRFVDVEDGAVLLDGRDVRTLTGGTVRRHVTGVTQDAHLFRADVATNLLLGRPDADDAALADAARRARVLDWVTSLPRGWSTVLDPAAISGGQRQRLLLARALLADPPVLVLDEPTEGLDDETADTVLADLLAATRNRTTLLVTHRTAGLDAVDEVVVLDRGRRIGSTR